MTNSGRYARGEMSATVVVPTVLGGTRLELLLDSLEDRPAWADVIVVDNGAGSGLDDFSLRRERVSVVSPGSNIGFGSAINLAVAQAPGETIVLVNDDCVCDPGFVEAMVAELDPANGVTMAAGIMRDPAAPEVIDSAGIDVDRSLLAFDYMNGKSFQALAAAAAPLGPSGVAAAFDKAAFLAVGGFDEHLFAYQEDVDLALRMRQPEHRRPGPRGVGRSRALRNAWNRTGARLPDRLRARVSASQMERYPQPREARTRPRRRLGHLPRPVRRRSLAHRRARPDRGSLDVGEAAAVPTHADRHTPAGLDASRRARPARSPAPAGALAPSRKRRLPAQEHGGPPHQRGRRPAALARA